VRLMESSWISRTLRHRVARIFLMIGSLGPGLALTFGPHEWGASPIFQQLSHLPVPLSFFGVSLILASLMIMLTKKLKDVGYVWIAMFYLVVNVSAGFAILAGHGTSALVFALPVLLWLYLEAAITATRDEALAVTALMELLEEEG
jgi:hypothetical protein